MSSLRRFFLLFGLLIVATVLIMGTVYFVRQYASSREAAKQSAEHRQYMVADMKKHCLIGARSIHDSEPDQKNVDYCDCSMSRTFDQVSDNEIEVSVTDGGAAIRKDISAKMREAASFCSAKVFPEGRVKSIH
jgi:hypothetical protein